jgi:hypothetical protein
MLRAPAVAGQFYPADPYQLRSQVEGFLARAEKPQPALMAMSPHAGYVYSGAVAGKTLGRVEVPRRVIVVGPNHRGLGAPVAIMISGAWQTPLGRVELDQELGQAVLRACPLVQEDALAHQYEHSLEVQVPFLQVRQPELLLTPLCLGGLDYDHCQELGRGLAAAVRELDEPVLMVASTDMTHYESADSARRKDSLAIDRVLNLDPKGLLHTVRSQGISMCGVLPTTVCLVAARELGASRAELVDYRHSGEVSGDYHQVVGYAGVVVS